MRRRGRSWLVQILQILAVLTIIQSIADISRRPVAIETHIDDDIYNSNGASAANRSAKAETVFIAGIHWNNEKILRSHWIPAVLELVQYLGSDKVFVSVQESGSWDHSKGALRTLEQHLSVAGVPHRIILDDTTHRDLISQVPSTSSTSLSRAGWVHTPRGRQEFRRIPFLAKLRNLVLEPLEELARTGMQFDKILFLNDVVFRVEDVARLLDTHDGDFAAACALDFAKPPHYYDTFALRDSEGSETLMQTWPYFRSRASRRALKAGQPVPVKSCWNGIAAFDAEPFYDAASPLRFRGIADSLSQLHLEASECCLIHADNPLSVDKGVWLNPNVRVAYTAAAYDLVNPGHGRSWMSDWEVLRGCCVNRLRRWTTTDRFKQLKIWWRMRSWPAQTTAAQRQPSQMPAADVERGTMCLVDELQVLCEHGWAHV